MTNLGVNIDHVATVRNARGENHPYPYLVAKYAIKCGANSITIHLREDKRHINDKDLKIISSIKQINLNLEIAATFKMLKVALKFKPNYVCLVPEKRMEITTEGGLNLNKNKYKLKSIINKLNKSNIRTSLFINASIKNIKLAKEFDANCIEIHTGKIANLVKKNKKFNKEFLNIKKCAKYAKSLNLDVHAGHGLDYKTTIILKKIKEINEYNIGHFIIGESIQHGLRNIIKKFKKILKNK
jgi:pyridoxine 5-phosphate synthase|tara:strand:- start:4542 stop:5264 length:723 start_codon:yes stop_codon:yes gene_type:complete